MFQISTVVISHLRPLLLAQCLESLSRAAQVFGKSRGLACIGDIGRDQIEILICINGPDPESLTIANGSASLSSTFTFAVQSLNSSESPAAARNRMVRLARGEWLFFIDDDAFVDEDFFLRFADATRDFPSASIIGGPNLTPAKSNAFQCASGAALASKFGSWVSSSRYTQRRSPTVFCGEESLILCNLFVRRAAMSAVIFPENFVCNEENWILQELKCTGHLMIHSPGLVVWHERRSKPSAFARQIHRYGMGRGQNLKHRPSSARVSHIMPSLCLLFTLTAWASWPWTHHLVNIWLALFSAYVLFWFLALSRFERPAQDPIKVRVVGALLFPLIHISYASGVLRGLVLHEK